MSEKREAVQLSFDGIEAPWVEEWQGMPEFCQHDLRPMKSVIVHFDSLSNYYEFANRIGQSVTPKTKSLWYPELEFDSFINKRYRRES
jgi:hypothetical protein